ncbi:MAG: hypothetical protein A3H28_13750 [Acidobacteria bacterium RIFCSPLOWO2_02_FULL_61_28]|nr:MAG: hypothetical protein A3H28_13750 [Acidobacteria bacterium RIFCSPLOWO2_02_FULL_61_28]
MSHLYQVGKPYIAGRRRWPEAVYYSYHRGGHWLRVFFHSLSVSEVEEVETGECDFALAVDGPIIFLLYRFGDTSRWQHASYSWHVVPERERKLPKPGTVESRAFLSVILVAAQSGMVRAVRRFSVSREFTQALHAAIRDQAASPWPGRAAYDAALADTYRRYPTSTDLLSLALARCRGGE